MAPERPLGSPPARPPRAAQGPVEAQQQCESTCGLKSYCVTMCNIPQEQKPDHKLEDGVIEEDQVDVLLSVPSFPGLETSRNEEAKLKDKV